MHYTVTVRGRSKEWACVVSEEQAKAMEEDGFEVVLIENSIPAWVVDLGLAHIWIAAEDLWNWPARLWRWIKGGKP